MYDTKTQGDGQTDIKENFMLNKLTGFDTQRKGLVDLSEEDLCSCKNIVRLFAK